MANSSEAPGASSGSLWPTQNQKRSWRRIFKVMVVVLILLGVFKLSMLYTLDDQFASILLTYLAILVIVLLSDVEGMLNVKLIREHWDRVSESAVGISCSSAGSVEETVVYISAKQVVSDASLEPRTRLWAFVQDSAVYAESLRETIIKNLFTNLALVGFALLSKQHIAGISFVDNEAASAIIQYTIRLCASYVAVIVQVAWFGAVLLHLRERSVSINAALNAKCG